MIGPELWLVGWQLGQDGTVVIHCARCDHDGAGLCWPIGALPAKGCPRRGLMLHAGAAADSGFGVVLSAGSFRGKLRPVGQFWQAHIRTTACL